MRLLSVSQSFCSRVPEMGRYKLSKRGSLPDFGRAVAREHTARANTQEEPAAVKSDRARARPRQGTLALGRVSSDAVGAGRDAQSAAAQVPVPGGSAKAETNVGRSSRFWSRMTRMWGWAQRRRVKSSRRPKDSPIQTAFSLETVRVVRNDLTESDHHVVVMKAKRGETGNEAGLKSGVGSAVVQRPLARIAAKLFTTGRPG